MARRKTTQRPASRGRGKKPSSGGSKKVWMILGCVAAVAIIGIIIWKLIVGPPYDEFKRADLDKYVEATQTINLLGGGAGVYVDMSDGMNYAYASSESQLLLQSIINKLAAEEVVSFTGMADGKLFPIELPHTALYNYIMNPANYKKQQAPVEETLKTILEKKQPALLMTDFEEYKGHQIEKAAYAKRVFIDWLADGYNIYFYRYPFTEKGKQKYMFITVFDDNAGRLKSLIESAIATSGTSIVDNYVLGSKDFNYPMSVDYASHVKGGGYHNVKGVDVVTNIQENGGPEDYYNYSQPYATSTGKGGYAPINKAFGAKAEYYPVGVTWKEAVDNANAQKEVSGEEIPYTHFLSHLYVDFKAQSAFDIEDVEARSFNMRETIKMVNDSTSVEELINRKDPEIKVFLTASMEPNNGTNENIPSWYEEISLDFNDEFTGTFPNQNTSDLIRVNIVISKATPRIEATRSFFSWQDNPSLANSVIETITAGSSNPTGRILYTYYVKSLAM